MPRAKKREEHIVYCITNNVNGKIYIGKTGLKSAKRLSQHFSNAAAGKPNSLYNAIRKYGKKQFTIEEIAVVPNEFINYVERLYILLYDAQNRDKGYNLTAGGDGGVTRVGNCITEEHKAAISKSSTGKKWTPEQRKVLMEARSKQADSNRGKPRVWKDGINPLLGKKRSPEVIARYEQRKIDIGFVKKPQKRYPHIPRVRTEIEKKATRLLQSSIQKARAVNSPPTNEARLKMKLASDKYWAEVKASGIKLSNKDRTKAVVNE